MPRKPKRPCSFPGCPELTEGRYCEKHRHLEDKRYNHFDRSPAAKRRYGRAWQKIRNAYAAKHPYCEQCFAEGRMVMMEHVHHIKPLAEGGTNDESNLISLCKSCHSRLHAERGDRWGKRTTVYRYEGNEVR